MPSIDEYCCVHRWGIRFNFFDNFLPMWHDIVVTEAFNVVASWSWLQKSLSHLNGLYVWWRCHFQLQNINKQLKMYDSIWSCYFRERVSPAVHNPNHDGCHFVPTKHILYFMCLRTHTKASLSRNSSFFCLSFFHFEFFVSLLVFVIVSSLLPKNMALDCQSSELCNFVLWAWKRSKRKS